MEGCRESAFREGLLRLCVVYLWPCRESACCEVGQACHPDCGCNGHFEQGVSRGLVCVNFQCKKWLGTDCGEAGECANVRVSVGYDRRGIHETVREAKMRQSVEVSIESSTASVPEGLEPPPLYLFGG